MTIKISQEMDVETMHLAICVSVLYHSITYWTQEAKRKERKQKVNMNVKEEEVKVIGGN
jgi:hypothetical protein